MNESIIIITIFLLLVLLVTFTLLRIISRLKKERERADQTKGSEVGFVVNTFHDLVGTLKDKERELEGLRKRAEERADVMESYNEYILQSVPSGVISLDSTLTITKVNAAAERILNLKADNALGKNCREILHEPLLSVIEGKTALDRGEVPYTTNSGKSMHLGLTITPLMDSSRETIGQLMVFTDLTELKALEAQAELRNRLSSLGEMAAGMAHELRNPMAVIAGYTQLLLKKIDTPLARDIEAIAKEVAVMDRIITDFLSFARPTELTPSAIDLGLLIEQCAASIIGERKDITLRFNGIRAGSLIEGDGILLRQAFINLIQNAVEAMPQGGTLTCSINPHGDFIEVTLADTGHGIPESIHDKIFLPFYTTKEKGTGLGLAIVHKIVVSHRGSISVGSDGQGTTFTVRLPRALKEEQQQRTTA